MIEINLLPRGLESNIPVAKILKTIKIVNVLGTLLFGLSLVVFSGVIIMNTQSLKDINQDIDAQKTKIKAMQKTEQQHYWVKERIDSLGEIMSTTNSFKELDELKLINISLFNLGDVSAFDVQSGKTNITANFESSRKLKDFFAELEKMNYSKITVDSLSFNQKTGYQAVFVLNK